MTTNYRRALATAVHCDLVDESPRELIKQLDTLGLLAAADHTEGNQK